MPAGGVDHARDTAAEDGSGTGEGGLGMLSVPAVGICDSAQGQHSQDTLQQHAAVSDGLGIGFLIQLLGSRAGRNQRVEAGNSTAGDGGEQNREHGILRVRALEQRQAVHGRMGHDHSHHSQRQHGVQQEGGQIIARLQQNPHGGDRSDHNVHAHDPHPGVGGQIERVEVHADGNDGHNGRHTDHRRHAHGRVAAINQDTEGHSNDDKEQRNHGNAGLAGGCRHIQHAVGVVGCAEIACHDGGKGRHHQDQGQIGKDDEQSLGALAHVGGDDLADGTAAVTHRSDQGAEVMYTAEEDAANQNPQHAGQPAEAATHGADGAGDGTGARDGGKVVAHEDGGLGGDIVDAVLHGMGRGLLAAFAHAPLFAQPAAVEHVPRNEDQHTND